MTVLVAATSRHYKSTSATFNEDRGILSWLTWAERWAEAGHKWFLSIQRDRDPRSDAMDAIGDIVRSVGGTVWQFSIEEGIDAVDNSSRLLGITTGRNLAHEFAQRDPDISHVLFLDTDVTPPVDCIDRLLEVYERYPDHSLVGAHVPTYCLDGPAVEGAPEHWDLRRHWNTAGALMIRRDAFLRLRWRWDHLAGVTDDPAMAADAVTMGFGATLVRHSVVAEHWPSMVYPFTQRGHRLSLVPEL